MELKTPNDIKAGEYTVRVTSDDGMSYSIDKLFLSSNFIGNQGPKNINVSYWQNGLKLKNRLITQLWTMVRNVEKC